MSRSRRIGVCHLKAKPRQRYPVDATNRDIASCDRFCIATSLVVRHNFSLSFLLDGYSNRATIFCEFAVYLTLESDDYSRYLIIVDAEMRTQRRK